MKLTIGMAVYEDFDGVYFDIIEHFKALLGEEVTNKIVDEVQLEFATNEGVTHDYCV